MDTTTSSPDFKSLNSALRDMLADMKAWQIEHRAENIKFYSDAIAHNQVRVLPGKEFTTRQSKCDCCLLPQKPGIRNFFYSNGTSFKFHVCDVCWGEIILAAGALILAQVQ